MSIRKTKIVCTLGPASDNEETIHQMMLAGMDVARFNFSHGTQESHKKTFDLVDKLRTKLKLPIAALVDTKGPEIRLGLFKGGKAQLTAKKRFTLYTTEREGDENGASITFPGLVHDVKVGGSILLNDGSIELRILDIQSDAIICEVANDGVISDRKGVNVPGVELSMPYISEKDRSDILFAAKTGFDFIAASFVRRAQDVLDIRQVLERSGNHALRIIAKIENAEGINNIDEILRVSDGIMVARGDMGVEVPFEDVPVFQKILIKKGYSAGKVVITATQMLESMINNPRPTRAEAADVANAIYDGTSAVMLSGETAAGKHPVEAVRTMAQIARRTEDDINYRSRFYTRNEEIAISNVTNAISHATCMTAYDLDAKAIITVTYSGTTARSISKYRPDIPIVACTHRGITYRQLAMSWGVIPLMAEEQTDTDELFAHAVQTARNAGLVEDGDIAVITAGVPLGINGTTNILKVQVVGDIIVTGQGINKKTAVGRVCIVREEDAASAANFRNGDILVTTQTSNEMLPLMKRASGIITERGGMNSHAAIVGLALDIPVVVFAENATGMLKSSTFVEIDAERGTVSACQQTNT